MKKRKDKGFTLLELLMVVIIIAILASIALPQYIRASEKARAAAPLNALGALRSAETRFRAMDDANEYADTANLGNLDITGLNIPVGWTGPVVTLASAAPGTNNTGFAEYTRSAGTFSGQIVGIQFGSGTVCGTFMPLVGTVACVAD